MDADQVAAHAVREMLANKAVIVPGALNQAIVGLSRYVPRTTILAVVSTIWGRTAAPSRGRATRHSTGQAARQGNPA